MERKVVIAGFARSPFQFASKGELATVRPDEMTAQVVRGLLEKTGVDAKEIEDLILGCAFPEGEQGLNMARMISLRAGLPDSVPAETINRYCSSGVQSIAHVAYAIQSGQIEAGIAGGAESMTMVPMAGYKFSPNPYFAHSSYELDQFSRVIKFTHLPQRCTVRLFTLAGSLIRTIEKNDGSSLLEWNLQTDNALPVGSGIYVYHVDAPGIGTKIGKVAVFVEKERLNNY